jgi:hypothetical protein
MRARFVTLTQQPPDFYRLSPDSPKKAAVATVFGLRRRPVTAVNLPVMHVKARVDRDRSRNFGPIRKLTGQMGIGRFRPVELKGQIL